MERDGRACIRWRGRNLYPSIRRSEFRYGQCDNRFGDFGGCARGSCSHCCNRRWGVGYGDGGGGENAENQGGSLGGGTRNGGAGGRFVFRSKRARGHRGG